MALPVMVKPNWNNFPGSGLADSLEMDVVDDSIVKAPDPHLLYLDEVFAAFKTFPAYSAILGICQDGLPLMIDFINPTAGSLLVKGINRFEIRKVLRTLLASAARISSPDQVRYFVISTEPDEFTDLLNSPHCDGLVAPFELRSSTAILELSTLARQRQLGREQGPAILLVVDQLEELCNEKVKYDVLLNLRWLISSGASSQIRIVASKSCKTTSEECNSLASLFGTQLQAKGRLEKPGRNPDPCWWRNEFIFSARVDNREIRFVPLQA